jgi:hypothetical protein
LLNVHFIAGDGFEDWEMPGYIGFFIGTIGLAFFWFSSVRHVHFFVAQLSFSDVVFVCLSLCRNDTTR